MKKLYAALTALVLSVMTVPAPAHAQDLSGVLLSVQDFINGLIPLLIGIAVALFLWGLASLMGSTDNAEKQKVARGRMVFGVVVLAVMIGIWGIVNILVYTLGVDVLRPPVVQAPGVGVGGGSGGGFGSGPSGGLVPCGQGENYCTACDIYKLIDNVIDLLLFLAVPFAVLSVSIGGSYILFGSGVNEGWVSTGKGYISTALWGLLVVLLSWMIINTILSYLSNPADFNLLLWYQVRC